MMTELDQKKEKNEKGKIEIVPTAMPTSYKDLVEKIERVAPFVSTIQIDVMDGQFVPSTSWPYNSVGESVGESGDESDNESVDKNWQALVNQDAGLPEWQNVEFEIDLMVKDQIAEAKKWISAGVGRVICHVEALRPEDKEEFLAFKEQGVEIALALVPETPNSALDEYLDHLDSVQFMGINKIGFQGQEFAPEVLEKISDLRSKKPDLPISVDGGVSFKTAKDLVNAGATRLASGSTIFNAQNTERVITDLKNMVN